MRNFIGLSQTYEKQHKLYQVQETYHKLQAKTLFPKLCLAEYHLFKHSKPSSCEEL